jgi:hypothetical protein
MAVIASLPVGATLLFALLLACFVLPGYGWVCWLHRADRLGWPLRVVMGFACSFALFSLLGGPFLWFRGRFTDFVTALSGVWAAFALCGTLAYLRYRRAPLPKAEPSPCAAEEALVPPDPPAVTVPFRAWALLGVYGGLVAAAVCLWVLGKDHARQALAFAAPPMLVLGAVLARRWRGLLTRLLRFDANDDTAPPPVWTVAAIVLIALQAVSAVVYDRPTWDDCFYLAAVLDYEQAAVLNDQEPTHREGFPMPAVHSAMCWELWGATLCQLSGVNPLALFHCLLPGLLVLGAYIAYASVLAEFLPRRWVPLALLGLSGYHLWGISSNASVADHFLVSIWQGRSVLPHVALPLTVLSLSRFAERRAWSWWLSLTACATFALGLSSSAIFLVTILVGLLSLALLRSVRAGRLVFLAGAAFSLMPLAVEALGIRTALAREGWDQVEGPGVTSWRHWMFELERQGGGGSAEVIWLVTLPLLAVLLGEGRRRAYFITFPVLLLVTFANPFLCNFVSAHVTSHLVYFRLLWLLPVGPGLAALFALLIRFVDRAAMRRLQPARPLVPLAVAALALAVCALLPGRYVWGPANNVGPYMSPRLAQNPEKLPPDLVPIAQLLAADPDIDQGQILCGEEVSSYLTPYSREFRFVITRPLYTAACLRSAGRLHEAVERHYLGLVVSRGKLAKDLSRSEWEFLEGVFGRPATEELLRSTAPPTLADVPRLLKRYQVRFIVTSPGLDVPERLRAQLLQGREELLRENGYEAAYRGDAYVLWKRHGGWTGTQEKRAQASNGFRGRHIKDSTPRQATCWRGPAPQGIDHPPKPLRLSPTGGIIPRPRIPRTATDSPPSV